MTISELTEAAICERVFPGCTWAVGNRTSVQLSAIGRFTYDPASPAVESSTIYDLASLTKVMATTTLAMILWENGSLDLDTPVRQYWPEFGKNGKERITIRHLLRHDSGLAPFRRFHEEASSEVDVLARVAGEPLQAEPGKKTAYSDLGFIALGYALERVTARKLDIIFRDEVAVPLGMRSTGFSPDQSRLNTIAPTEKTTEWRLNFHRLRGIEEEKVSWKEPGGNRFIRGEAHDETCLLMGGVSGHAGLFGSVEDLAAFCQFLLNGSDSGQAVGRSSLPSFGTIRSFTRRQSMASSRALGWDSRPLGGFSLAGRLFGNHSFGHTGFTGTSLWVDPEAERFAVLLTNRVHPTRDGPDIGPWRSRFADLAFRLALPG